MNGGKWNHLMSQIHIGYTKWSEPKQLVMLAVKRVEGTPKGTLTFPTPMPEGAYYAAKKDKYEFKERDGYVSIEAEHFTRKTDGKAARWTVIPEMGRTLSAITPQPVTASTEGMALEYDIYTEGDGYPRVTLRFSPTLNFNTKGLSYAVSWDEERKP